MIILENLTCGYTDKPVLKAINWHIRTGENWVLTGGMGAGKTTLTKTLLGQIRILEGKLHYRFLENPESYEERKQKIHLVSFTDSGKLFQSVNAVHYYQQRYQAFDSDGHLTVQEYLEDGGLDLQNTHHLELIRLLKLEPLLNLERIKLSSGQTRKLLLCKVFFGQPRILILDNPHVGLDDQSRHTFNEHLDLLVNHFNQQLVLSGHFRGLPKCINNQLHLNKGAIEYCGALQRPERESSYRKKSIEIELLPILRQDCEIKNVEQILNFDHLQIKYANKTVIEDLDWEVKKGEKWLVRGPNGSGKSTIISLIYGDHPQAYSNKITLFDRRRGTGESIWDIKKKIGFTSSELHSYFNYNHRAAEVVLSGLTDTFFPGNGDPDKMHLCKLLFEYFDLSEEMQTPFQKLSTGMQRLLFFMRALIKFPPVLLLDEPYQGLDRVSIERCNTLLESILTPVHTLIFISHFDDEVPNIVTRELILK
ncbi:MAG: ATP-binding cassette domain-containing protein [Saprospiraceae bacterium]|nr:ATP-binding cassette domain-containing protein [Saprospiraceae bacterium]